MRTADKRHTATITAKMNYDFRMVTNRWHKMNDMIYCRVHIDVDTNNVLFRIRVWCASERTLRCVALCCVVKLL